VTAPATPPFPERLPDAAYRRMTLVLRVGLGASLAILVSGLVAYLLVHPSATSSSALSTNPILGYLSVGGLAAGLAAGHIEAYLTLGLLVLLATPIVRVLSGFYYFERGHERTMALVTITVFVLLLFGLFVLGPYVR
jgi:uncharacterized membrane protein